jgi:hypothetical protein
MATSTSRFNLVVMRGKRRLMLHKSLGELSTALRIACEFSKLRPTKLAGMYIAETSTGAIWSVTDLVEGTVIPDVTSIAAAAAAQQQQEEQQQQEPLQANG